MNSSTVRPRCGFLVLLILGGVAVIGLASLERSRALAQIKIAEAPLDSDGDGFTDEQERSWFTDPNNANSHPDLETGLAAWWPLDEGSGTKVADLSGNALTGTVSGARGSVWASDDNTGSIIFDGQETRVTVSDSSFLRPSNAVSIVLWIKPNADGVILTKGDSYGLSVVNGKLALKTTVAGQYRPLFGQRQLTNGEWHHLAWAYDGFEVRLYVDGKRDVTTHTGGELLSAGDSMVMGQFAGSLRDVGVYKRCFSDGEIKLLYETVSTTAPGIAKRRPSAPSFLLAHRESLFQAARGAR